MGPLLAQRSRREQKSRDRGIVRQGPASRRGGNRTRDLGRSRRLQGLGGDAGVRARSDILPRRRRAGRQNQRNCRRPHSGVRIDRRQGRFRSRLLLRSLEDCGRRDAKIAGRNDAAHGARPVWLYRAPAARRDRRHRAVQRPISSRHEEGGFGARRRQWLHSEALGTYAGDGAQDRRSVRRSGSAARPPQRRPRARVGSWRGHFRRPPGADDHLHRLNADRSPSRRRSREDAETLHARDGRKEPA